MKYVKKELVQRVILNLSLSDSQKGILYKDQLFYIIRK